MENEVIVYEPPKTELISNKNNYNLTIGDYNTKLVRNVDFGKLPNTKTPTLFKAGAEKVLTGFGLNYDIIISDSHKDYQNGFFYYECMARAYYNGQVVRVGVGCCNTNESNFGTQKSYNAANAALKKAKKRAVVDLALTLACLSDAFTQDIEDENNAIKAKEILSDDDPITAKQMQRLFAIAADNEITREKAKDLIHLWGFESSKDIKQKDYNKICEKMKNYNGGKE